MFDLITGRAPHMPRPGTGAVLVSTVLHTTALGVIVLVPLLLMTNSVPRVPAMMAFIATTPVLPPAPPPAAPPATPAQPQRRPEAAATRPVPVAAPAPPEATLEPETRLADVGVVDGTAGGVPEGVIGGMVGGVVNEAPPPPPPPAKPVKIAGQVRPPTLLYRVEPVYPPAAAVDRVQGVVILEATVNSEGRVIDLRVLRSVPLLDQAAKDAVMQWRYSPVILNGAPVPFVLTVMVSFSMIDARTGGRY